MLLVPYRAICCCEVRGAAASGPENQYHIKLVAAQGALCLPCYTMGSYVCVLRLLLSRTRLNAHIITPCS